MIKFFGRMAVVAAALMAMPVAATTITWSGLGNGALSGTYDEGGYRFTWSAASYSQLVGGVRVVENNPTLTSGNSATSFTVARIGGGLFSFDAVTAANLNGVVGPIGNHGPARETQFIVQGFLNNTQLYGPLLTANRNTLATQASGVSATSVDQLNFILGGGVFPTDVEAVTNIVLTEAQVPEPAMLGLFGLGVVGLAVRRRRPDAAANVGR